MKKIIIFALVLVILASVSPVKAQPDGVIQNPYLLNPGQSWKVPIFCPLYKIVITGKYYQVLNPNVSIKTILGELVFVNHERYPVSISVIFYNNHVYLPVLNGG
jgi:hypothetical protein